MQSIEYEDFAILLEPSRQGFRVRILNSLYGGGESHLQLPFDLAYIPDLLADLENDAWRPNCLEDISSNRHLSVSKEVKTAPASLAHKVGAALFESLFSGEVLESYLLSRGKIEADPNKGLRLRLIIDPSSPETVALASLPWELLYQKRRNDFISRNIRTPVIRHFDVTQARHPAPIDSGLKILIAACSPIDYKSLDIEREKFWIDNSWLPHKAVEIHTAQNATFKHVHEKLRDGCFEVFHFIGHGDVNCDTGECSLIFETDDGRADPISAEVIAEHLGSIRSLRLITLNACETARLPRQGGRSIYTGIASSLVVKGVPAVVAMQFPIQDRAAIKFSEGFYSAIASGLPIDAAIAEGRLAIFRELPNSLAWATPVLFSSVADGRIFSPPIASYGIDTRIGLSIPDVKTTEVIEANAPGSSAPLKQFANRECELSRLLSILKLDDTRPRLEVWNSRPASGISQFLRYAAGRLRHAGLVVYADCSIQSPNAIFSQILLTLFNNYSELWHSFELFLLARMAGGAATKGTTQAALKGLPYISSSSISMRFDLGDIIATNFSSAAAELVCEFLVSLRNNLNVLVLLDNAQDIDDWSLDLLRTTTGGTYRKIRYLLAVIERSASKTNLWEKLEPNLHAGYDIIRVDFPEPSARLTQEIAALYGRHISRADAESIVAGANANIYQILKALEGAGATPSWMTTAACDRLSPVERELLSMLSTAGQGLRRSDVLALCLQTDLLLADHEYEIDQAISNLAEAQVVTAHDLPDGDCLIALACSSSAISKSGNGVSFSENLITAERLYKYFARLRTTSSRHSSSEVIPLLYRLSKLVDPDSTGSLIQALLGISLAMGSLSAAERFVKSSTLALDRGAESYEDFVVRVLFYLSLRLHRKALRLIEENAKPQWNNLRLVSILHAIALNRSRHHQASDALLEKLLGTSRSIEESVLLTAYRIAGQIHMNNIEEAKKIFCGSWPCLKDAINSGYLLRNAASAFGSKEAAKMLSEALEKFSLQHDRFGYATSLANRAMSLLSLGQKKQALVDTKEAQETLELFGIHHQHVVMNNLGLAELANNNYEGAERAFWQALSISRTAMPTAFHKINLSAVFSLTGRREEAHRIIRDLEPEVRTFSFDRLRQRFYINAALVMALCNCPVELVREACENAVRYPDRKNPRSTLVKVERLLSILSARSSISSAEFRRLWVPCSLSYWYQNPIEGLPTDILSSKTML